MEFWRLAVFSGSGCAMLAYTSDVIVTGREL